MDQYADPADQPGRAPLIYLAPVVPAEGTITPSMDQTLTEVARTARLGDSVARDSLYWAVVGRLEPSMRRLYRLHERTHGSTYLELQDVRQSSYLVFVDMISTWKREDSFVSYLFGMFHWRLKEALRAYDRRRLVRMPAGEIADSPDSAASVVEIERLLAILPERQRLIVHLRLSGGLSFPEIGAALGVSARTIQRDVEAIAEAVRRSGDR